MYDIESRRAALELCAAGHSLNSVSRHTGISRSTLRAWRARPQPLTPRTGCWRCARDAAPHASAYSYLLGLYLGDGCISAQPNGVHRLRIFCSDAWPGLVNACESALRATMPSRSVSRVHKQGCQEVASYSKHWTCLFPQHGPGRKHERRIALEPWQRDIVDAHPWELIRGLIHSDGCRITNWATRQVGGVRKRYEYPRYFFTNTSADIIRIYTDTLTRVGVEWRASARHGGSGVNVSVARKASVALMDAHVGPKY
ncbi:helix-turn-helix domain-containing protein [Streptomyces sp. WMMC897]|uniref:helix-turn-helix domain-containing protein n=1 Tax=Streptomyces sp. WMMC897 TaxID=3014782 RepID=UPI0022B69E1C|nr:helix-turn-helix domain-containing protein [Streptomyces sp. WMMC897]MCZ7413672.1 helix-turn-helix domain-containing protein [Streptomyces sp. WMMC897]